MRGTARSTDLAIDTEPMIWHGWGDPRRRQGLPGDAEAFLAAAIGGFGDLESPVALADVRVGPSALGAPQREALEAVVGADHVRDDHRTRVEHAGGKSYPDLLRRRRGDAVAAPDAVVLPGDHHEVARLLAVCAAHGIAVVPFGGGTSVVGGVEPERGPFTALITVDLARMDRLLGLDEVAHVATFEPGLRGPAAEAQLRARGFTLGHFPQSYAYATLGGFVATRSAGQASTGYGRIDDMVCGVRCATPAGDLRLGHGTASAAGPDLVGMLVGSEGTLGILTEVALRVRPAPDLELHEAWVAPSFASGAASVRSLAQAGCAPDVVRLSDGDETRAGLAQTGGWRARALATYLGLRGYDEPSLLILGWEGGADGVARRRGASTALLRRRRVLRLGEGAGRAWAAGRFDGPYLRDELLDRGVMVETLETATTWSRLGPVYHAVRGALRSALAARGTPALVMCHISHLYRTGASLYFTWVARQQRGAELAQWHDAKEAASVAIAGEGATITHHHAVGTDHRPWMTAEVGALALDALRAVKDRLDPTGILNPGKLLPPPDGAAELPYHDEHLPVARARSD